MDFAFSEEQQMLKDTARRFLEKECPKTRVRELMASPEGYSADLWNRTVQLGWLALPFPEEYGGADGTFLDLAVILDETGRALMPGPFFSTILLGGFPISDGGSQKQKKEILPQIAAGKLILTMAFLEQGAAYDPSDVSLSAVSKADFFELNGTKLFVPYANVADLILTTARVGDGEGSSILLVDAKAPGVECFVLDTIDSSKLCEVTYKNVRVPKSRLLGVQGKATTLVEKTLARAAIAECLQLVGSAQVALEMAVDYSKSRVQFDKPIAAFQAIQHHCADMAVTLDAARFLTYQTAWLLSQGMPCDREVARTKAWVSEACYRILLKAHQVHGGYGFVSEHDLTLHYRKTAAGEIAFGGPNYHYIRAASAMGL